MFRKYKEIGIILFLSLQCSLSAFSQKGGNEFTDKLGQLNYSSLDYWYSRKVKESFVLSGKTIDLYEVGVVSPQADLYDTKLKDPKSPWERPTFTQKWYSTLRIPVFSPKSVDLVIAVASKRPFDETTSPD